MAEPKVICVILNTNRRDDTLECLASLAANTYTNHQTIVLDNQSIDGSVQAIRDSFPDVDIIELTENCGYAGNNNQGIAYATDRGAEWVFVVNEDTVFDRECLAKLVEIGESEPKIGIVGPMVYHYDEPNIIQSAGGLISPQWESVHIALNELDNGEYQVARDVDWISGCAILVRRSVIEQVGMIDERYFYYWEETEWCLRAKKAGWRIVHVPKAKLWHKGVQRHYEPKPSVTYYSTRNSLLTMAKHNASFSMKMLVWSRYLRTLGSWSVKRRWRHMSAHRDAMLHGIIDFCRGKYGQMPTRS